MAKAMKMGGFYGTGGDKYSTLPPPISNLSLSLPETIEGVPNTNGKILVSFDLIDEKYMQYLGNTAYIVVVKEGDMPQSPDDGVSIRLDKNGAIIEKGAQ